MELVSKKRLMEEIYPFFAQDKSMVLLVGDMGFSVLDKYFANHSDRVFNVGIAEQATIGMAAGMAKEGMKPIVYSQIPFLTMRAYEQVRYDICEHNLGVLLIGVGADNYFEALGRSHCMDDDDIRLMSILANLEIISEDLDTIKMRFSKILLFDTPKYIRSR